MKIDFFFLLLLHLRCVYILFSIYACVLLYSCYVFPIITVSIFLFSTKSSMLPSFAFCPPFLLCEDVCALYIVYCLNIKYFITKIIIIERITSQSSPFHQVRDYRWKFIYYSVSERLDDMAKKSQWTHHQSIYECCTIF